jgi:hypothetical protein
MAVLCLLLWFLPQEEPKALPELNFLLAEVRKTLHPDDVLLSQYTYTEKLTDTEIGSDGKPKKTDVDVYQVTRETGSGQVYRRLVSRNGEAVNSAKPEKVRGARRRSAREEDRILDDVFAGYDIQILDREDVDKRSAIRLTFRPRPNYKPKTLEGRLLHCLAGEAWVNASDYAVTRVDAEMVNTFSIGFGLLAKLQKGARIHVERHKINDEVWLPANIEVSLTARLLVLKEFNRRQIVEYSDYKKFNVETIIQFPDAEKSEKP